MKRTCDIKVGDVYGMWRVLSREKYNNMNMWKCECVKCNYIHYFETYPLKHNPPRCIKCTKHPKFQDLTGQKFGELTVLFFDNEKSGSDSFWVCQCSCGNRTSVWGSDLKRGKTTSCGCKIAKVFKNRKERNSHKKSKTRLYSIWISMKQRCYNSNCNSFKYYGGRGIKVCEEWKNNFLSFEKWSIENGYSENLTLDRIDVNGNYCQENCRWATQVEQQNNLRNNHRESYAGITKTIAEWSHFLNINQTTIRNWVRNEEKTFQQYLEEFLLKNGCNTLDEYIYDLQSTTKGK